MKNLLGTLTIIGVFAVMGIAYAATNPNPFNVPGKSPAPPAAEIAPAPTPTVTVLPSTASPQFDILMWIWTALGTAFTGIMGKIAFKPAAAGAPGAPAIPSGVATVLKKLHDPATVDGLEALGLRVVQTGVPGSLIQSGASLIPGVGPFAAQLEPLLRKVVIDALQKNAAPPVSP